MRWRKAAILGVGLLGGSLGQALRSRGLAREVAGFVRRTTAIPEALASEAVDVASTALDAVLDGADLIVLCTPVAEMAMLVRDLVPLLAPGALVTDVGSVKAAVIAAAESPIEGAGANFVGSHPMAGSDRTGVGSARADLFAGAVAVVTPTPASNPGAVSATQGLWEGVGARVLTMPAGKHDELVARSSHLPHFVAAALADYILDPGHASEQGQLCATGFRDTTRVASGSPEMWRDIALANRQALLSALDGFGAALNEVRSAIEKSDAAAVERFLRAAKERRDRWCGGPGAMGGRTVAE